MKNNSIKLSRSILMCYRFLNVTAQRNRCPRVIGSLHTMTSDGSLLIISSFFQVVVFVFSLSQVPLCWFFTLPLARTSCASSRASALCSLICFTNPKASKPLAAGLIKYAHWQNNKKWHSQRNVTKECSIQAYGHTPKEQECAFL
jgi:hypothetical protein